MKGELKSFITFLRRFILFLMFLLFLLFFEDCFYFYIIIVLLCLLFPSSNGIWLSYWKTFLRLWGFKVGFHICTNLENAWSTQCDYDKVNVYWFVSFKSLDVACFTRNYYLTKNGISFETFLSLKFNRMSFVNIRKYLEFFCLSLPPRSQPLIAIVLHVCYQHLNAVKVFFCLLARALIMAQKLWSVASTSAIQFAWCCLIKIKLIVVF